MGPKPPDTERRRAVRASAAVLCMAPIPGTVKDLNGFGLGLETWDPLPVQSNFAATIGQAGQQARLHCRVVWCRLVRTESTGSSTVIPIYRSGLRFLDLDERSNGSRKPAATSAFDES